MKFIFTLVCTFALSVVLQLVLERTRMPGWLVWWTTFVVTLVALMCLPEEYFGAYVERTLLWLSR